MNRYQKLTKMLPQEADAILITSEVNQRYLTGFAFTDGYVLATRRGGYLLTDFRYMEAAKREAAAEWEVLQPEKGFYAAISDILKRDGAKRVAYEDGVLTCRGLKQLQAALPEFAFMPAGTVLEDMRICKDPEEVENIVRAQRIAEAALEHLIGVLRPDMTEIEVAAELEYAMRRGGAAGTSFDTIAISGTLTSCPHGVPRPVKLQPGFLTLDFGALYRGYCSDMTRTLVLGRATEEMRRVYDTVLRAQTAALEAVGPGADCGEMDKIARDIIDGAGYRGAFGHSLGHGVGLFIHERPNLAARCVGQKLVPGNVVTVEPGIYLENRFGVRIEDMVYIRENGAENLTKAPKEMLELDIF